MKKISILLVVIFALIGSNGWAQNCPTSVVTASNNVVSTFHSGGMKASDGTYYFWGEDMSPTTNFQSLLTGASGWGSNGLPTVTTSGVTTLKYPVYGIQGGSNGSGANQLAVLSGDNKIYFNGQTGNINAGSGSFNTQIALPTGVLASNVGSFYGGFNTMAIVDYGSSTGTSGTAYTNAGGSTWTTIASPTNFVQVRGDAVSTTEKVFIGFTADNKIYVWGAGLASPFNVTSPTEIQKPTTMSGNIILVGANLTSTTPALYILTSSGEMWSIGDNAYGQLGNIDGGSSNANPGTLAAAGATWRRVQTAAGTPASVGYFSPTEHDNGTAPATNDASYPAGVSMILTNGELWSFGYNGSFGILGINSNATSSFPPTITKTTGGASMLGTTASNTATMVEMGGHITIIQKADGYWCAAGHGQSGSLLGSSAAGQIYFGDCFKPAAAGCPLPICRTTAPNLNPTSATLSCSATGYDLTSITFDNDPGGTFVKKWYTDAALSNEITSTTTPSTTNAPIGTYYVKYYAPSINGTACNSSATSFEVKAPVGPASAPTVSSTSISNICTSGSTVNLRPLINSTLSGVFVRFYTVSNKTQHTADSINSSAYGTSGDVYAYYITNGAPLNSFCITGATKITVNIISAPALTSGGSTITNSCPTTTVNLNTSIATPLPAGVEVRWYTANNKTTVTADSLSSSAYGTAGDVYAYYVQTGATLGSSCIKGPSAKVTFTKTSCFSATINCTATKIITAPVAGTAGQKVLAISLTTKGGTTQVTSVSGAGFSLANGASSFTISLPVTATDVTYTVYIPVYYDGTALTNTNKLEFHINGVTGGTTTSTTAPNVAGDGCLLDLSQVVDKRQATTETWSTECLPTCGPGLK